MEHPVNGSRNVKLHEGIGNKSGTYGGTHIRKASYLKIKKPHVSDT